MSAQGLPAHILALFTPRPPVEPLPKSMDCHKRRRSIFPMGVFLDEFEEPEEHAEAQAKESLKKKYETPREVHLRRMKEKYNSHQDNIRELRAEYDPKNDPNVGSSKALNTLFVARIAYDTSEKKLRKEFEQYGGVRRVKMVYNSESGKPRGYAFVEYENERDVRTAYKQADGKKIDGRRILVDIERGRTVEGWYPRRLAGGRGSGRKTRAPTSAKKLAKLAREGVVPEGADERERDRYAGGGGYGGGDRGGYGGGGYGAGDRGGYRDRDRERGDRDRERDRGGERRDRERDRGGDRDRDRDRDRRR